MKTADQEYKLVAVDQIKPHPKNPNKGHLVSIAESVEANGFYGAVIVQKSTGFILAGNHRYRVAVDSGAKEIPVIFVDVDEINAKKIMIADNRTTRLGKDDEQILSELLSELATKDDLFGTGYNDNDLDEMIANMAGELENKESFAEVDADNLDTEYQCPKCKHEWSGSPK